MKPILTIFTPTYNRAHTIGRTYESLKNRIVKSLFGLLLMMDLRIILQS